MVVASLTTMYTGNHFGDSAFPVFFADQELDLHAPAAGLAILSSPRGLAPVEARNAGRSPGDNIDLGPDRLNGLVIFAVAGQTYPPRKPARG